jgi:hypothetical protein
MNKVTLLNELHAIRLKLHQMAESKGSLTDPDVLAVSQEADRLIVAIQQLLRDEQGYALSLTAELSEEL